MARPERSPISVSGRGHASGDAQRTVVWVRGDHDISTEASLAAAIARAARLDGDDLFVDLSGVTFMDASTVGAIIGSINRLKSSSQSLAIRAPSPWARRVLEVCGLAHLVQPAPQPAIHPSGAAAALSTWVEVPRSARTSSDPTPGGPAPIGGRSTAAAGALRQGSEPARTALTDRDAEADRTHP